MNKVRFDKKSIVYRVTSLVIILIVAQAVLLLVLFVFGGVMSQAKKNAYSTFSEKVLNRKEYLQREMSTRWTNLDPYLGQITELIGDNQDTDLFFTDISDKLVSIMRATQATGVFVILNPKAGQEYPAIYLRDYDPVLNDYGNKDLYMLFGPSELANNMQIPLDQMWRHKLDLENMEHDFYEKAFLSGKLTDYSNPIGYWSLPFQLFPEDIPIITYTEPLMIKDNEVVGVIGVEISIQYFKQFLPATDLQDKDSLGYVIGYEQKGMEGILPVLRTRAIQNQILRRDDYISTRIIDKNKDIYVLDDPAYKGDIYLSMEKMDLYSDNTPYEDEQWYLIGLMRGDSLLSFVNKLQNVIMISLLTSVLTGIAGGYFVSYRFTKPIILLARKVKDCDMSERLVLEKTGLTEVDELSHAIQKANDSLLESAVKMSRIIDFAELPIGAYEYRADYNHVFVTEQVMSILGIAPEKAAILQGNKKLFQEKIEEIRKYQEQGEANIYSLPENPNKWIKWKEVINEKTTMGIIMDVTDEIIEKKKIIYDRDYDYLTRILNRKALQRIGNNILTDRNHSLETAILMFDLDNLKNINDNYGHEWGDKYIKRAVHHLKRFYPERMILGRRSGDEFVIVLYDFQTREEIRTSVQDFYLKLEDDLMHFPGGTEKTVHITSGLVWINDMNGNFDSYLQLADTALYRAKKENKGTCMEYEISKE